MDTNVCLNISLPFVGSKAFHDSSFKNYRFLFITDNEILHQAGNKLQVTKLTTSVNSRTSKDEIFSQLASTPNSIGNRSTFAEAELGRGFTSFCFNRYRGRVAYSPRSTRPPIYIKSLHGKEILCKIEVGVHLEYVDMSFNQTGSRLVAIGKGDIGSVLFVWSIEMRRLTENERNGEQLHTVLMTKHELTSSVHRCLFSPTDDNTIALVHSNRPLISICQLAKFIDEWKVTDNNYLLNCQDDKNITAIAWETQNQLLLGTSCGSLFITGESTSNKVETLLSQDDMITYGAVRSIIVTTLYIIAGFQCGKIVFVSRQGKDESIMKINVCREVDVKGDIVDMLCDTSFKNVVVLSQAGNIHSFFISESQDDPNSHHSIYSSEESCQVNIHTGIISSLASVVMTGKASVTLLISGGCDGKIKALKDSSSLHVSNNLHSTLACLDIGSPITVIESLQGYPVCAVGSADGCLRFIYFGRSKESIDNIESNSFSNNAFPVDLIELKSEALAFTPITSLQFSSKTKKLVAGCYESAQAFIVCAEPTNLHVLGIVETADKTQIVATSWCSQDPSRLLIGSLSGKISCFDTTMLCFSPDPLAPLWQCSLGISDSIEVMSLTARSNERIVVFVSPADFKGVKVCEITVENNVAIIEQTIVISGCFEKPCCFLSVDKDMLLTGSACGEIAIFHHYDGQYSNEPFYRKKLHIKPILDIVFSSDKARIYSTSMDGTIYAHTVTSPGPILHSAYEYDYLLPKNPRRKKVALETLDKQVCDEKGRRKTWLCKAKDRLDGENELESANTKQIIRNKVASLRTRVKNLLENNIKANDLERLNEKQLIIDLQQNEIQEEIAASKIQAHIDKLKGEGIKNQMQFEEIKGRYLESMQYKFCRVHSLIDGPSTFSINSFPLHLQSSKEKRVFEIIYTLRCNEISEIQRNVYRASRNAKCWSTHLVDTRSKDFTNVYDVFHDDHNNDIEDNDEYFDIKMDKGFSYSRLLYPYLAVRTKCQRIIQVYLLCQANRDAVVSFNEGLERMKIRKQQLIVDIESAIAKIEAMTENVNLTIQQYPINEDIYPEDFDETNLYISKKITSSNSVSDFSMVDPKLQRALDDMMNGSLKAVTKNKRIESKDVEKKITELKSVETTIKNAVSTFNNDLLELKKTYQNLLGERIYNDLYQVLSANCVFQSEDIMGHADKLKLQTQLNKQKLNDYIINDVKKAKVEYERVNNDLMQKIQEDKFLDKSFRKRIQQSHGETIDQETLKLLFQLFHHRGQSLKQKQKITRKKMVDTSSITRRSKIGRQSGRSSYNNTIGSVQAHIRQGSQHNTNSIQHNMESALKEASNEQMFDQDNVFVAENEPFPIDNNVVKNDDVLYEDLSTDLIPQGFVISNNVWSSLKRLRDEKKLKEKEIEESTATVNYTKVLLDSVESVQANMTRTIRDTTRQFEQLTKIIKTDTSEILLTIQQGQDEMRGCSLSWNYEQAILIPTSYLERISNGFSKNRSEKKEMYLKKRKLQGLIEKLQWKQEVLELKEFHQRELCIDFQLLHLTNELKSLLHGEEFVIHETPQVEGQLSRQKVAYDAKITKLLNEQKTLTKMIQDRTNENNKLKEQLVSLRNTVAVKEKSTKGIKKSQHEHALKMKKIIQRSNLLEMARKQGRVISQLRSELDNLHQKTFPSFPE